MRSQNHVLILGIGGFPNKRKRGWVAPRHCSPLRPLSIILPFTIGIKSTSAATFGSRCAFHFFRMQIAGTICARYAAQSVRVQNLLQPVKYVYDRPCIPPNQIGAWLHIISSFRIEFRSKHSRHKRRWPPSEKWLRFM